MNRPADPERRAELLTRIVDHALSHGITSLTLRPTADAVGSSARMLIHYFGSRDAMVAEVILAVEERLVGAIAREAQQGDAESVLRALWQATAAAELRPLVRAVFETWGRALVRPDEFGDYLQRVFSPWRDAFAVALMAANEPEASARTKATLAMAAFNGLQLARLTTGEGTAIEDALDLMCRQILRQRRE